MSRTRTLIRSIAWLEGPLRNLLDSELREADRMAATTAAVYLASCREGHLSGIFILRLAVMAEDLHIGVDRARELLTILESVGFLEYDDGARIVWVIDQCGDEFCGAVKRSDNRATAVEKVLRELPASFLKDRFRRRYPEFAAPAALKEVPRGFEERSQGLARGFEGPSANGRVDARKEERGAGARSPNLETSLTGGSDTTSVSVYDAQGGLA